jgi:hypothetical protein
VAPDLSAEALDFPNWYDPETMLGTNLGKLVKVSRLAERLE